MVNLPTPAPLPTQATQATQATATRAHIVRQARTWLHTPYQHQARCKGAGVDCIGLIVGVAKELGLSQADAHCYGRIPSGNALVAALQQHAVPIAPSAAWLPGQILLIRFDAEPQHVAILADMAGQQTMLHAYSNAGYVTEHRLADVWRARVMARYDFPGVV
jgi:NlpC/P60 family putative phage cell wall peptidase